MINESIHSILLLMELFLASFIKFQPMTKLNNSPQSYYYRGNTATMKT